MNYDTGFKIIPEVSRRSGLYSGAARGRHGGATRGVRGVSDVRRTCYRWLRRILRCGRRTWRTQGTLELACGDPLRRRYSEAELGYRGVRSVWLLELLDGTL